MNAGAYLGVLTTLDVGCQIFAENLEILYVLPWKFASFSSRQTYLSTIQDLARNLEFLIYNRQVFPICNMNTPLNQCPWWVSLLLLEKKLLASHTKPYYRGVIINFKYHTTRSTGYQCLKKFATV